MLDNDDNDDDDDDDKCKTFSIQCRIKIPSSNTHDEWRQDYTLPVRSTLYSVLYLINQPSTQPSFPPWPKTTYTKSCMYYSVYPHVLSSSVQSSPVPAQFIRIDTFIHTCMHACTKPPLYLRLLFDSFQALLRTLCWYSTPYSGNQPLVLVLVLVRALPFLFLPFSLEKSLFWVSLNRKKKNREAGEVGIWGITSY